MTSGRLLLGTQPDIDLVATASTLPELLAAVDLHVPDVVVTEIRMPPGDGDEGIQAAETLTRTHPGLGIGAAMMRSASDTARVPVAA